VARSGHPVVSPKVQIGLLPTEVTLSAKGELRRLVCSVVAATRDNGADRAEGQPQEYLRGE
jgi:hypothetical protein